MKFSKIAELEIGRLLEQAIDAGTPPVGAIAPENANAQSALASNAPISTKVSTSAAEVRAADSGMKKAADNLLSLTNTTKDEVQTADTLQDPTAKAEQLKSTREKIVKGLDQNRNTFYTNLANRDSELGKTLDTIDSEIEKSTGSRPASPDPKLTAGISAAGAAGVSTPAATSTASSKTQSTTATATTTATTGTQRAGSVTVKERLMLESVINSLITEALRGFSLDKFKTLKTFKEMRRYAESVLPYLGEGSSRVAFAVSSSKVLKIAKAENGIAQNLEELNIFTDSTTRAAITKIYNYNTDGMWLISEIAKPLTSALEFAAMARIDYSLFSNLISRYEDVREDGDNIDPVYSSIDDLFNKRIENERTQLARAERAGVKNQIKLRKKNISQLERARKNPFVTGILRLIDQGSSAGDLANNRMDTDGEISTSIKHYGKTIDGRLVLLDYGLTGEIWEQFYKKKNSSDAAPAWIADRFNEPDIAFDPAMFLGREQGEDTRGARHAALRPEQPSSNEENSDSETSEDEGTSKNLFI